MSIGACMDQKKVDQGLPWVLWSLNPIKACKDLNASNTVFITARAQVPEDLTFLKEFDVCHWCNINDFSSLIRYRKTSIDILQKNRSYVEISQNENRNTKLSSYLVGKFWQRYLTTLDLVCSTSKWHRYIELRTSMAKYRCLLFNFNSHFRCLHRWQTIELEHRRTMMFCL